MRRHQICEIRDTSFTLQVSQHARERAMRGLGRSRARLYHPFELAIGVASM